MLFIAAWCTVMDYAIAAVRDASTINRNQSNQGIISRATNAPAKNKNTVVSRTSTARTTGTTVARSTGTSRISTSQSAIAARSAAAKKTRMPGPATTARTATNTSVVRTATTNRAKATGTARTARAARAATTINANQTNAFDEGYNICRDAYFTCMDQFCATQNDSYRRCVCSSRLTEIQGYERALSQTANQIQDFNDLNIEVIPKTAAEVNAMLSATDGEKIATTGKDNSGSAQQLAGISAVLSGTKSKSLSTLGTLDIAGDINAIWATTDLTSGVTIANLTGEALYNAVHTQCVELISDRCASKSTLNMVVSAYGMYIENDCTTLANALGKQKNAAQGTIRETERKMNDARLENYNAHNSTSINDCIDLVRTDITADTACGKDYVHCLDISGKYLNKTTGEPIYTADFYQLETQISLSGDVLTNQSNHMLVIELNRRREFAKRSLDTCRDLADEVWDEFMRQAITEIYQGQQERIRQVKEECLEVVNTCYDEQNQSLKDFSNVKEQMLLGSRLELSEQMCREKLDACSNLYGGGPDGLAELLTAMHTITDQKIAKECRVTLEDFARDMCSPSKNDSLHAYPFACCVYAPGEQIYASNPFCNQLLWTSENQSDSDDEPSQPRPPAPIKGYTCQSYKRYISCKEGHYMATLSATGTWVYNGTSQPGNACLPCPTDSTCPGGNAAPSTTAPINDDPAQCGEDYAGSLYQKMVRYAMQACIRPSDAEDQTKPLPTTVLQDVNVVMSQIHVDMATSLSAECDRLGGIWIDTPWINNKGQTMNEIKGHVLYERFYTETGANTKWGYCATPETASDEDKISIESQKNGCIASDGTWSETIEICTCPDTKAWIAAKSMCVWKDSEKACTGTGGTWDVTMKKCTCGTGTKLDNTTQECKRTS